MQDRIRTRPTSAVAATRPGAQTGRASATGAERRGGRAPVVRRHRSGRGATDFSHLAGLEYVEAGASGLSEARMQEMWGEAFARAGVSVDENRSASPQWDRALVRAGVIKAR
jgi:hypothetical protein